MCTSVGVGTLTHAETPVTLAVILYHFPLCSLRHATLNLELTVTAGGPASEPLRSACLGQVVNVCCHASLLHGGGDPDSGPQLSKKHCIH